MNVISIISIVAVIVAPIVSVWLGNHLQKLSMKRKDKIDLFKTLMMSRNGWTVESVRALNILDIVFSDDPAVRKAWKEYYDKLCTDNPSPNDLMKIQNAQYNLLETMAISLGYKDKITWKTIQNPYLPKGMLEAEQNQRIFQDGHIAAAQIAMQMLKQGTAQPNDPNISTVS